jgi:acetate CoA/acetoacetate CoA-transferase alpha subunit
MAKSKVVTIDEAMAKIRSGMTIMIPGFVNAGVPETLIKAIIAKGYTDLDVYQQYKCSGRSHGMLVREHRFKHITCSHIGTQQGDDEQVNTGDNQCTLIAAGTHCERVRAGGAGIGGLLSPRCRYPDGRRQADARGKRQKIHP